MKEFWILFLIYVFRQALAFGTCDLKHAQSNMLQPKNEPNDYGDDDYDEVQLPALPPVISYSCIVCTYHNNNTESFDFHGVFAFPMIAKYITFKTSVIPVIQSRAFSLLNQVLVFELYLNNSQIKVIRSNAFEGLGRLELLDLQYNQLTEITAGMFTYLDLLKILDISNNEIEIIDNNAFVALHFLEKLFLNCNKLKSVSSHSFNGLSSIHYLNLSHNELGSIPDNWELFFSNALLNGIKPIQGNNNDYRKTLDLSWNNLTVFNFSSELHLNYLNLSNNRIKEVNHLDELLYIINLDISHNNLIEIFNVSNSLNYLNISSNNISELSGLPYDYKNLTTFDISNNSINYINPNFFENVSALETLCLQNNHLDHIPIGSFHSLDKLLVLNLSSNFLTEFNFGTFAGLKNLETLDVSNNSLHNFGSNSFHTLPNLKNLNIASNHLIALDTKDLLHYCRFLRTISINHNPWSCQSLLQLTKASPHDSPVTILDGLNVKNAKQVHGIICSDNEYLDVSYTTRPNFENNKIDVSELNGLKRFLQVEFTNSSFYKYFQNERIHNYSAISNYFENGFKNSTFYQFFNQSQYLNRLNESVINLSKMLELVGPKILNSTSRTSSQLNEALQNLSNYFDRDFKKSAFYKYFDGDFANAKYYKLSNSKEAALESSLLKMSNAVEAIPKYFENGFKNSTFFRLIQSEPLNRSVDQNVIAAQFLNSKLTDDEPAVVKSNLQESTFITLMTILIIILLCMLLVLVFKNVPKPFFGKLKNVKESQSMTELEL